MNKKFKILKIFLIIDNLFILNLLIFLIKNLIIFNFKNKSLKN